MQLEFLEDGTVEITERFMLEEGTKGAIDIWTTVDAADDVRRIRAAAIPQMIAGLQRAISLLEQEQQS